MIIVSIITRGRIRNDTQMSLISLFDAMRKTNKQLIDQMSREKIFLLVELLIIIR